jgi:hypothetical protein
MLERVRGQNDVDAVIGIRKAADIFVPDSLEGSAPWNVDSKLRVLKTGMPPEHRMKRPRTIDLGHRESAKALFLDEFGGRPCVFGVMQ